MHQPTNLGTSFRIVLFCSIVLLYIVRTNNGEHESMSERRPISVLNFAGIFVRVAELKAGNFECRWLASQREITSTCPRRRGNVMW